MKVKENIDIGRSLMRHVCGSKTLRKKGNNVVCDFCAYEIKNYKKMELELGSVEFNRWERGFKK